MASIHTVLDAVIENGTSGKRVQIEVADRNEYETIRTRLVTLWADHKEILQAIAEDADPLVACSLCADFVQATATTSCLASYYLGKPRRKMAKSYDFSIVDPAADTNTVIGAPANDDTIPTTITRSAE
jgi:hypothetical protein